MSLSQEEMKNARTSGNYDQIWQNTGKCVFCDLKDKYIIHKENGIALTVNLFPYIDGQLMAIPLRHVASPKELTQLEWETMRKFAYLAKKMIKDVHKIKGMWTLMREGTVDAQMSVSDHLHMQFIPFDKADLCNWNYRELKFTPIENVNNYLKNKKEFIKDYYKFDSKYLNISGVSVVVDLIIVDKDNKVCFQERKDEFKFNPDILTLPGGHVDDYSVDLLDSLSKEVKEELGVNIEKKNITIVDSRLSNLGYPVRFRGINKTFNRNKTFLWNTYITKDFIDHQRIVVGDDCKNVIWMDIKEIEDAHNITNELKQTIIKVLSTI